MTHHRASRDEADEALAWLFGRRPGLEVGTGFDPDGWEDSIWVLNAMYEFEDASITLTHDEAERWERAGGASMDEHPIRAALNELLSTGVELGMAVNPGSRWHRVLWAEYAERLGMPLPVRNGVPNARLFCSGNWPVTIDPPCEGSLDEDSLSALLDAITRIVPGGGATRCRAFFANIPTWDWDCPTLFHTRLDEIRDLPIVASRFYSPHNIWLDDRSWFVYTAYDLSATRVSGSARLIRSLEENPELETFRLDRVERSLYRRCALTEAGVWGPLAP